MWKKELKNIFWVGKYLSFTKCNQKSQLWSILTNFLELLISACMLSFAKFHNCNILQSRGGRTFTLLLSPPPPPHWNSCSKYPHYTYGKFFVSLELLLSQWFDCNILNLCCLHFPITFLSLNAFFNLLIRCRSKNDISKI